MPTRRDAASDPPTSRLPNPHSRPFLLAVRSIQQVPRRTRTVRAGMTILLPRNNERGDVIEALEGGLRGSSMHLSTIVWLAGGGFVIGVIALVAVVRRGQTDDLGSVSTAWTTEHNASYHGDGSANP